MLSTTEMLKLAQSHSPSDRSKFLRLGCDISEPGFVMMYHEMLGAEMYRKVVMTADGEFCHSVNPTTVILGTDNWRVWDLNSDQLYIGYDPQQREENKWWAAFRKVLGAKIARKVPKMYGRLVLFRPRDHLSCNELEGRRELINFAVTRFLRGAQYKFCWEKNNS